MAKRKGRASSRKYTRNEKVFYFLSMLIIISMVLVSVLMIFDTGSNVTGHSF